MPELEISRSKKLKPSKMSKLRGGLKIKHIASHRCQISSFEKGKSSGSFPGLRQHHRHPRRAHCKQSAPVRSHHAAFFHIRQQRWFGRFANLFFLQRLARRYAARHVGTLPYLFSGGLQAVWVGLVPGGGVEPPRAEARRILSSERTRNQRLARQCYEL